MKCFKSFFKHTWHLQQMEDTSRYQSSKVTSQNVNETELGEMKIGIPTTSMTTSPAGTGTIPCKRGGCRSSGIRHPPRPENPWHMLKTIFLIAAIVAMILWIIVFALLTQYKIV